MAQVMILRETLRVVTHRAVSLPSEKSKRVAVRN